MASKKKISFTKEQIIGVAVLVVLFVIFIVTLLNKLYGNSNLNGSTNDYQTFVNKLVTADFTLVSSSNDNSIDNSTFTDDYTTQLSYDQAITVMESNADTLGYHTPINAQCFGGVEYQTNRGIIDICETKIKKGVNGETTFKIQLIDFNTGPVQTPAPGTCVGDCKNQ